MNTELGLDIILSSSQLATGKVFSQLVTVMLSNSTTS